MRGLLHRLPDGTLTAQLRDKWGHVHTLTGTQTEGGYAVEVTLTEIPEALWLPGDEAWFKVVPKQ